MVLQGGVILIRNPQALPGQEKIRKAASQPDVRGMQTELADAKKKALVAEVRLEAYGLASELNVDIAKMPYIR